MKRVDIKINTCIDSSKEITDKDPKFKIIGSVRISKYKSVFPNLPEEVFVIKKFKKHCAIDTYY